MDGSRLTERVTRDSAFDPNPPVERDIGSRQMQRAGGQDNGVGHFCFSLPTCGVRAGANKKAPCLSHAAGTAGHLQSSGWQFYASSLSP
jgi:hypothetical protein